MRGHVEGQYRHTVNAPKGAGKGAAIMAAKTLEQKIAEAVAAAMAAMTPADVKPETTDPKPEKAPTIGYFNVKTCERLKIARKIGADFTYTGKSGTSAWVVVEVPKSGGVLAEKAPA